MVATKQHEETAKILFWDIEASNLQADFGITLAFGYKYLGESDAKVLCLSDFKLYRKDRVNDRELVEAAYEILLNADMWCTYYGTRFDQKFIQARLLYHNLGVLPPIPHVDLYDQARKLALHSRRLGNLGEFLSLRGEKTVLSGPVWIRAVAGDRDAMEYVREHCLRDVLLLEEAYLRLRPLMVRHPRITLSSLEPCRVCGGRVIRRGYSLLVRGERRRKIRVQCTACGAWENRPDTA